MYPKINNCKNCGGYGYYRYFDGGGSPETRKCGVCKAKPLKVERSAKEDAGEASPKGELLSSP